MSFIEACINDTDTIDLSFNGSNELEADLRLGSEGTIEADATGAQVRFSGSSGLGTDSNGLIVDSQLPGLNRDANGVAKVTTAASAAWIPGGADDTVTHNFPIARGSTTVIFNSTLTVSVAQSVATRIVFVPYFSARYRTTWLGLGDAATNVNDEVGLQIQSNINSAGWVVVDRHELAGNNQRTTANLKGIRTVLASNGTSQVMQFRGVVTGGILSATAVQGVLERSFYKGAICWY